MEKHPRLVDKFQLLYLLQLNTNIKTHADLSKAVGISRQAVTKWCRGGPTSRGNAIPLNKVETVANLFGVSHAWFSLSYEEFEREVRKIVDKAAAHSKTNKVRTSTGTLPVTDLNIYGRDSELRLLDESWNNKDVNVVEVVAFGGAGKSALVNKWLSELSKTNYCGAENVYAWSFYWQSELSSSHSAGDYFVEHALEWFGDPEPTRGTHWSKAERLIELVRSARTLLILDGLESLQQFAGERTGVIGNPAVSLIVKELASENTGLCIITTRYEVADFTSYRDGRVRALKIPPLKSHASRELLRHHGVSGSPTELDRISDSYAGHPLSLVILAGYVATAHSGELRIFSRISSTLGEGYELEYLKRLMHDYLHWLSDKPGIQVLRMLCLVGRCISLSDLRDICNSARILGLTDKLQTIDAIEWKYLIRELCNSLLVTVDDSKPEPTLDCHPLIRDYVEECMSRDMEDGWVEGNELLFNYLLATLDYSPEKIGDMNPFFRAVIHGVRAGKYEEAFSFYYLKIKNRQFSIQTEGSHCADQACIKSFFQREWDEPVSILHEDAQHYLIMSAATNLIYLGNIREAIAPSKRSTNWFRKKGDHLNAALATGPLISMYIATGDLDSASQLLEEVSYDVKETDNHVLEAMLLNFKAYILYLEGDGDVAGELFESAEAELTQLVPSSSVQFPTISSYYCKYLLEQGELRKALERSLKTMAWRKMGAWQVKVDTNSILASDILVLGLIFLKLGDISNARAQLQRQVEIFQSANEWLYLPTGLNSRARYFAAVGKFDAAASDLLESLEISQRTGAKFGEWEAHLDMAQLFVSTRCYDDALRSLENAENLPGMSQYKFRDAEIQGLRSKLAVH